MSRISRFRSPPRVPAHRTAVSSTSAVVSGRNVGACTPTRAEVLAPVHHPREAVVVEQHQQRGTAVREVEVAGHGTT